MLTFLKAQATAIIATGVDFTLMLLLCKVFGVWYLAANTISVISGGIVSFLLGRNWAFSSKDEEVETQAVKFLVVWVGNFLLNTGGLYLMTQWLGEQHAWISKIAVSVLIGIGYNYVLQKFFVFRKSTQQFSKG